MQETGGFLLSAPECGFAQQALGGEARHFPQGLQAAARDGDGGIAGREPEGIGELRRTDKDFRNLAVIRGADEHFPHDGLEGDVDDGVGESRVD